MVENGDIRRCVIRHVWGISLSEIGDEKVGYLVGHGHGDAEEEALVVLTYLACFGCAFGRTVGKIRCLG